MFILIQICSLLNTIEKWSYEGEVRFVFSKNKKDSRIKENGELKLLQMPAPKRIFIGCKALDNLEEIIRKAFPQAQIIKMKMSGNNKGEVVAS